MLEKYYILSRLPDCLIINFNPIMPALCRHIKTTYYTQNNGSIRVLCLSLVPSELQHAVIEFLRVGCCGQ